MIKKKICIIKLGALGDVLRTTTILKVLNADIFCSPITQRILSMILLLPQPLGPMMPVIPSSKLTTVLSAKLLNPLISNDFNLTFPQFSTCEHTRKEEEFLERLYPCV